MKNDQSRSEILDGIILPAKTIARAAKLLAKVCRQNRIPILSHALIRRDESGRVGIGVTDLDCDLTYYPDGDCVGDPMSFTMGLHELNVFAAAVGRDEGADTAINLQSRKNGRIVLATEDSEMHAETLQVADLPTTELGKHLGAVPIVPIQFAAGLRAVQPFINRKEHRYYLNGIYLESGADHLVFVATDGHRLGMRPIAAPGVVLPKNMIIPSGAVVLILAILDEEIKAGRGGDSLTLNIYDRGLALATRNWSLTSRMIDGTYPDYRRIIAAQSDFTIDLPRAALLRTMVSICAINNQRGTSAKFALTAGSDTLRLTSRSPDFGEFTRQIAIAKQLRDFEIGFNAAYIKSVLETFDCETIQVGFGGPGDPSVWRPAGELDPENPSGCGVVMPMKLGTDG